VEASSVARNVPSWRQALVTLASGVLLVISTCSGLLPNHLLQNSPSWFVPVWIIGFLLSGPLVLIGIVFVIMRFVSDRRARRQPPPSPM
jgi:hypothetical protein